jgi:hypothetical protein
MFPVLELSEGISYSIEHVLEWFHMKILWHCGFAPGMIIRC